MSQNTVYRMTWHEKKKHKILVQIICYKFFLLYQGLLPLSIYSTTGYQQVRVLVLLPLHYHCCCYARSPIVTARIDSVDYHEVFHPYLFVKLSKAFTLVRAFGVR